MKKIILITLLAFLLTGCGTSNAKVSNPDDVIWKSNKVIFTKQDLNDHLKAQNYSYMILRPLITKIAELESIDTEAAKADAEEQWQNVVDSGLKDYYEQSYGSKDYFIESAVINEAYSKLVEKYVNDNYDTFKEEQHPYKAQIAYFDSLDTVNKIIADVNNGTHTFEYSVQENGYTQDATEQVYCDAGDLPVEVKDAVLNSETIGLLDVVQTSTYATDNDGNTALTPRYYLINVTSRDVESFKDEFIEYIQNKVADPAAALSSYMKKYNLKFYDQRSFELIKETYGEFK